MENDINDFDDIFLEEDNIILKKKLKVACYIRVSTVEQTEMYWDELQLERIKKYLEARKDDLEFAWEELNFDDPFVFYDWWVSWADKIESREELTRLFHTLDYSWKENKPFDIVIVFKIDRFARDLKVLLEISDRLKEFWVWFVSTQESIDTSTPFWNAMLWILWVFAELEREMIKERTMLWMIESFKDWKAKKVPYWYRKDANWRPMIYESEAIIIREIFDKIILWSTIPEIIRDLVKRKIPIPTASGSDTSHLSRMKDSYKWEDKTIRWILENEFYIWKLYYNKSRKIKDEKWKKKTVHLDKSKWKLSPVFHSPLILEDDFKKVQEMIWLKKWNFHRSEKNYILSWLLKCWYCEQHRPWGSIWWSWTWWAGKYSYYHCNWKKSRNSINGYLCKCSQLDKNELEELVINEIKSIFNNLDVLNSYINKKNNLPNILKRKENDLSKLNDEVKKAENILENIKIWAFTLWLYSWEEFKLKYEDQKNKVDEVKNKLRVLEKSFDKIFNSDKYQKWLKILKTIVQEDLNILFKDKEKIWNFLEFIIEDIVLYSRDRLDTDVIRWQKPDWQQIPYKMKIKFKLPQEFLKEYIKFSIKWV